MKFLIDFSQCSQDLLEECVQVLIDNHETGTPRSSVEGWVRGALKRKESFEIRIDNSGVYYSTINYKESYVGEEPTIIREVGDLEAVLVTVKLLQE